MQGYTEHHVTFWERKIMLSNVDEIYISMAMKVSSMTTYSLMGVQISEENLASIFLGRSKPIW